MKKNSRRKLIKKLDKLFSEIVRSLGYCQRCGKRDNLQCAHILSRRILRLRWYVDNALVLCYACHLHWAHRNPVEFFRFVEKKLGKEKIKELERMSVDVVKYSTEYLEQIYIDLKAQSRKKLDI